MRRLNARRQLCAFRRPPLSWHRVQGSGCTPCNPRSIGLPSNSPGRLDYRETRRVYWITQTLARCVDYPETRSVYWIIQQMAGCIRLPRNSQQSARGGFGVVNSGVSGRYATSRFVVYAIASAKSRWFVQGASRLSNRFTNPGWLLRAGPSSASVKLGSP